MKNSTRNFIQILAILSLVLAAASPACKFISGQLIEICAADGTLQTIIAPEGLAPPQLPAKQDEHKKSDPCVFCFSQTHTHLALAHCVVLALFALAAAAKCMPGRSDVLYRYELRVRLETL